RGVDEETAAIVFVGAVEHHRRVTAVRQAVDLDARGALAGSVALHPVDVAAEDGEAARMRLIAVEGARSDEALRAGGLGHDVDAAGRGAGAAFEDVDVGVVDGNLGPGIL